MRCSRCCRGSGLGQAAAGTGANSSLSQQLLCAPCCCTVHCVDMVNCACTVFTMSSVHCLLLYSVHTITFNCVDAELYSVHPVKCSLSAVCIVNSAKSSVHSVPSTPGAKTTKNCQNCSTHCCQERTKLLTVHSVCSKLNVRPITVLYLWCTVHSE